MGVLHWKKPEKIMSVEEWRRISADDAPPGVHVPNMSEADKQRWKAKHVGGKYPRVEIRKTASVSQTQMVLVVSLTGTPMGKNAWQSRLDKTVDEDHDVNVRLSMNGTAKLTFEELEQMSEGVAEARRVLEAKA